MATMIIIKGLKAVANTGPLDFITNPWTQYEILDVTIPYTWKNKHIFRESERERETERERERQRYRIGSCKEIHVPANCPNRGFMFHNKGDSNGLQSANKANKGSERELMVLVCLQCMRLVINETEQIKLNLWEIKHVQLVFLLLSSGPILVNQLNYL